MHLRLPPATTTLALLLLSACAGAAARTVTSDSITIADIRQATAKYRDVHAALADGYVRDPANMCFIPSMEGEPDWLGSMGIHYFRPDLLGITRTSPRVSGTGTHTDFLHPGVLLYEPEADGSLKLIAVENLVFEKAWRAAGHTSPPSFEGHEYFHMVDNPRTPADEAHGFEPHYELHVWTERKNPRGDFFQFNPAVTCKYFKGQPATNGKTHD